MYRRSARDGAVVGQWAPRLIRGSPLLTPWGFAVIVFVLGETVNKITIGTVAAFAMTIGLAAPAQADTRQDQQLVCNEGLAHGVSAREMQTTLVGKGYSSQEASTLIRRAVQVYCPERSDALAGLGGGSDSPIPASPEATGEWWGNPTLGQSVCSLSQGYGRDWTVNNGIGGFNGTAEGAHFVDALIAKYCPQYVS